MSMTKKKRIKKRTSFVLTPSRKAKLIMMAILQYAESGGMQPEHCGLVLEAVGNCLTSVDDPEAVLSGLIDEIQSIINANEWVA